ncbi:MAG TPA: PKD domain-containing protein, partial [Chloroflexi bacterium]|nr:PKD domain-containing protein [Chloroflexota bacterium]
MSYITDTSGFPHTGGGGQVVWDLGTVAPGEWIGFSVFAEVTASEGEWITNTVEIVTSDPYEQGEEWEKRAEWSGEVVANDTHLNVGKDAWTGDPAAGAPLVFSVNVCNNGGTGSTQVTLTDTLHPSMTLQTWWSDMPGWSEVASSAQQLVVTKPAIQGWHCEGVYIRATVDAAAWPGMELSNHAVITAANDLSTDDDEAWWWGNVGDPHTNLYVNKHWGHGQLVPGGDLHYWINDNNNGNLPVGAFRITDTLPVSTTFQAAWRHDQYGQHPVPPIYTGTDYVAWEFSGLDNGYGDSIELVLSVDRDAAPGAVLVNTAEITCLPDEDTCDDNVSRWTETLFDYGPNLRIRKDGWWDDWGDATRRASYHLRVENVGNETVDWVTITDVYPTGMYLDGGVGGGFGQWWDWRDHGDHLTITLESLEPNWSVDFDFGVITDTEPLPFGLIFTNTADVTLHPEDANPDDKVDIAVLTTGPDLWVEKELLGGELLPGELVTFSLRFGNEHEGHEWWWNTQGSVRLTDTLPGGFTFITATRRSWDWAPYAPVYDDGIHIAWDTGDMPAGGEDELHVTARIPETATGLDSFTNHAEAASTEPISDTEPYYDNNHATLDLPIDLPYFEVGKAYESTEIAGMPITYTLTVTNIGNSVGTGVILSDTIPSELENVGGSGTLQFPWMWWHFDVITPDGGTALGSFDATLPCTVGLSIVNDDYGVRWSDQGVTGAGDPVSLTVRVPNIQVALTHTLGVIVVSDTVRFTGTASTDGTGLSYTWDMGGGRGPTSGGVTITHVYTRDGDYTVVLTATDSCGYSRAATATVTVSPPNLAADFDYSPKPANVVEGNTVIFTDTSTTNVPSIVAWQWDFGDGSALAFTQNATHTYETAGVYTVTLVVTDTLGYSAAEVKTAIVTVTESCIELTGVTFEYAPSNPIIGTAVVFTADIEPLGATPLITYVWDFGDGVTHTVYTTSTTHTYAASGTLDVLVTAYNPCTPAGVSATQSIDIAARRVFLPLVLRNG